MRTMSSRSMLCAFFDKRMTGPDAGQITSVLFGPFWAEVDKLDLALVAVPYKEQVSRQWEVPVAWTHRAQDDGTATALALLDFRVNRFCRLLAVSDCWPSIIGCHLAHWLDSHMHLVLAVERRRSGPAREDLLDARRFRACDWRYEVSAHTMGVREIFFNSQESTSPFGKMYTKLIANMALCKTLHRSVRNFGSLTDGRETVCSAFTRCLLGVGAHKADLSLRKSVHSALAEGTNALFAKIENLSMDHEFPIVFVALREFTILSAQDDFSLSRYLAKTPKWTAFAANARNTAEMVRVRLRERTADGDLFDYKLGSDTLEKVALLRHSKKVPGLFSRCNSKSLHLGAVCKLLKRFRDKTTGNPALTTDVFTNVMGVAVSGMRLMNTLPVTSLVPLDFIRQALHSAGPKAESAFVDIVNASVIGTDKIMQVLTKYAGTDDIETFPDALAVSCECLELIHHCESFFTIDLPTAYGDKQREAVLKRFSDSMVSDTEKFHRASKILWCGGCKSVKNFVLCNDKVLTQSHSAHGYKKVSQTEQGVMCYEKRRFICCQKVPLREHTILTETKSECLSIFGQVYVITTCCGALALLEHVSPTTHSALCCRKCCAEQIVPKSRATKTLVCHYCEERIIATKGSYTGKFTRECGTIEMLSFCKRHSRTFMKREMGPLELNECMIEISKRIKI